MTIRDMDALYLKQDNKTLCLSHVVLSAIYIYTVSQKKKSQFVRFCGVCCLHCAILMGRCQLGRPVSGTWPICSSSQDSSKKKALARRIIHSTQCFALLVDDRGTLFVGAAQSHMCFVGLPLQDFVFWA